MSGGWGEGEGGFLDGKEFTILKARFGQDPGYNKGATSLLILEGEDETGQEQHAWIKIGDQWEASEDGSEAVHETEVNKKPGERKRKWNKQSNMFAWINSAIEAITEHFGDRKKALDFLAERGSQYEAKVWEGLTFRIERRDMGRSFTNQQGEVVNIEWDLCGEFLHEETMPKPSKPVEKGEKPVEKGEKSAENGLYEKMVQQAKKMDDSGEEEFILHCVDSWDLDASDPKIEKAWQETHS